jgi:hypothetical protein
LKRSGDEQEVPALRHLKLTVVLLVLLAALPTAARAGDVIVVDGNSQRHTDDPDLPPTEQTDPLAIAPYCGMAPDLPKVHAAKDKKITVKTALADALKADAITTDAYKGYREDYTNARTTLKSLTGQRRTELGSVVNTLEAIAGRGQLTSSRMPSLFLTLRRNTEYWPGHSFPTAPPTPTGQKKPCAGASGQGGARVTFKGDPVIYQWYPGRGLQIQQLANFSAANGLYQRCVDPTPDPLKPCDELALKAMLDRLIEISSKRAGATSWEYYFAFGGGQPPWGSGLAQGTAIQALARGYSLLGVDAYKTAAHDALGLFEMAPPAGVAVKADGGTHFLIYSFSPGLRVLNAFLQGITGLYDMAKLTGDQDAQRLFTAGDTAARKEVPEFDTGRWSLYNLGGHESDLGYHRLVRDFLQNLCDRTGTDVYCHYAKLFTDYQHIRVKLRVQEIKKPFKVKKPAKLIFSVDKVSCTQLAIIKSPGTPKATNVYGSQAVVGRGSHAVTWTPAKRGNYLVRVVAIDLNSHKKQVQQEFKVK